MLVRLIPPPQATARQRPWYPRRQQESKPLADLLLLSSWGAYLRECSLRDVDVEAVGFRDRGRIPACT